MARIETTEQTSSSHPLLSLRLLSSVVPELGRELQDVALGPAGQQREDVAQVGPGLDAVALTAGDQRGGDGVPLGAVITSAEAPVRAHVDRLRVHEDARPRGQHQKPPERTHQPNERHLIEVIGNTHDGARADDDLEASCRRTRILSLHWHNPKKPGDIFGFADTRSRCALSRCRLSPKLVFLSGQRPRADIDL
jgi:hypothetical protein